MFAVLEKVEEGFYSGHTPFGFILYNINRVANVCNLLPCHIVSSPTLSTCRSPLQKHVFFSFGRVHYLRCVLY